MTQVSFSTMLSRSGLISKTDAKQLRRARDERREDPSFPHVSYLEMEYDAGHGAEVSRVGMGRLQHTLRDPSIFDGRHFISCYHGYTYV